MLQARELPAGGLCSGFYDLVAVRFSPEVMVLGVGDHFGDRSCPSGRCATYSGEHNTRPPVASVMPVAGAASRWS
jgi:hypothetical protein